MLENKLGLFKNITRTGVVYFAINFFGLIFLITLFQVNPVWMQEAKPIFGWLMVGTAIASFINVVAIPMMFRKKEVTEEEIKERNI